MKKILFLMQLPPPVHGASVVNKTIKESCAVNSKYDCKFIDISPAKEISDLGKVSLGKTLKSINILYRLVVCFISFKPDLVYLTISPHGAAFYKDSLLALAVKLLRGNLIYHLHGKGIDQIVKGSVLQKYLYRFIFSGVDVIHLAPCLLKDIENIITGNSKLYILPNGVDLESASDSRENSCSLEEELRFIYLSNLVPTKGIDTYIDAINLLQYPKDINVRFNVVGGSRDQDFTDNLKSKVKSVWRDSVKFHGPLYGNEKNEILRSCNVFVLPTRFKNECFPLSILEAMANGLAVISTFEGAIPDIIQNGRDGFLVNASDSSALADCFMRYIKNPSLSKEHGSNGKEKYIASYRISNFESKLIEILDDNLNRH
jgi:glycosyltransferase involved in cell wall biosynthesis